MPSGFFKKLFSLCRPFKKRLRLVFLLILFFEFFKLAPTYILARLLDRVLAFSSDAVGFIVTLLLALFLVSNLVTWLEYFLDKKILAFLLDLHISMLKNCQAKLLALPLKYHEENFTGKQVNMIHQGVTRIDELFFNAFYGFFPTIVQILMSFSVLIFINFKAGLVFFIFIPIYFYLTYRMGIKLQPLRRAYHDQFEMATGKFGETIMHIRTVQDFAQEQYEKKLYDDFLEVYKKLRVERDNLERTFTVYRDMVLTVGRVGILAYGLYLLATGIVTPGFFVLIVTLSEKAYLGLFRIGRTYNFISDSFEAVDRISVLLNLTTEGVNVGENIKEAKAGVEFQAVDFCYQPGRLVLSEVSFTINPREIVAVVGRSGAGKSTLVKLLFRHFDPVAGRIFFDGQDVKKISKNSLRQKMAIVSQDIELFHTTIRKNILYGHAAEPEEFARVCQLAHIDEFVRKYPAGYETLVGERGVRLSGGQKQRIAIARALLRKPKLLIFDEATSSLDSESEQLIQKAIFDISKNFTMIIIAHRLSTIAHADKILVLEEGRLVETGSYDELIKRGQVFAKMVKIQKESGLRT